MKALLIFLLLAPLIYGFGFFGGGGENIFNFDFDENGGDEDTHTKGKESASSALKKTICSDPSRPLLCPVSSFIALVYKLDHECVSRYIECSCPIPGEKKCLLGDDAFICVPDKELCPNFKK
jgi:hypothetical protein